jgi:hypothetical protein
LYFAGRSWGEMDATVLSAAGAMVRVCVQARLAWEGPLVMMRPGRRPAEERG